MTKPNGLNLLEGSLLKNIIKLGYPMALGSLAQTLYDLADTFWLGKLGREAVSAPIISYHIVFFIISIALGFSISGTSLVSQYIGAKEREKANHSAGNLLWYLFLISIILSVPGLLLAGPLLKLLGTPGEAFDLTLSYYSIMIAGMPLAFPIFVYQSVMNGYGDTISPLKITLVTAAINMVLDPVLIFGWLGLPVLGVKGAALTTVLTRALASSAGLYLFFSGKKGIKLKLRHLKPDINLSRLIIKIGIPSAVGFTWASLGFIVVMGIVNQFGTPVVSAYGISTRVIHFFMLPAMGISAAVTAIVGQNLGAGNIQRAKATVVKGTILMLCIIVPPTVLTFIFGRQVTMFFIPGDPLIHRIGQVMFYITPPSLISFGLSTVLQGAFHGSGHTVPVMVTNLARIWLFRIPFVYLISVVLLGGPGDIHACVGIWWGMMASNFLSYLILYLWYKKGTWTKTRIKKELKPPG
jgi:putative MATE family efflux protein